MNYFSPTKVESLKNISQISHGYSGLHFLAKDFQEKIFVVGCNDYGQLGTGNTEPASIPIELNSDYFTIWGSQKNRAKSARK